MSRRKTEHACAPQRPVSVKAGYPDFAALTVIGAAPGVLLLWLVPPAFVLPSLSIVSFAIAGVVALIARHAGIDRRASGVNAWDVAAVFTGIWIFTGLVSGAGFAAAFDVPATHMVAGH